MLGYTTKPFLLTIISKSSSDYNKLKYFLTNFMSNSAKIQTPGLKNTVDGRFVTGCAVKVYAKAGLGRKAGHKKYVFSPIFNKTTSKTKILDRSR